MRLAPITCTSCAAPLPLAVPTAEVACAHCGTANTLPPAHVEAAELRRRENAARREIEPLWRRLEPGPGPRVAITALVLLVALPPAATLVAWLLPSAALDATEVTALVTLPAALPGATLWLWTSALAATTLTLRAALCARDVSATGASCRTCAAPLVIEPGAVAATCGYCGTDSVLASPPLAAIAASQRDAVATLAEATHKLRTRRATLALGALGLVVLLAGSSVLVWLAASSPG